MGYLFGPVFLLSAIYLFLQGLYLKWKDQFSWIGVIIGERAITKAGRFSEESHNKVGNISFIASAVFLIMAILVFIYPLRFEDIIAGGFACFFITIIIGIFFVFKQ